MKKLLWLAFSGLIPMCILFVALYLFDPLQIFHKPYWRENFFVRDMRDQAYGIISNYEFDSVILGSSILQNTSSFEAKQKLSGEWVNLSISGGNLQERLAVIKETIKKHKVRNVIFSISWHEAKRFPKQYSLNPFLYNGIRLDDFFVYANPKYFLCLFYQNLCLREGRKNLDRPARWGDKEDAQALFGGFQNWIEKNPKQATKQLFENLTNLNNKQKDNQDYFPKELLHFIQENPQINFILVIPPFSRLYYKLNSHTSKSMIKDILALHLKNIKVYGFDNTDIPNNLSLYMDQFHYDEKVNSFMLDAIKNDTHRITLENVDNYFEEMRKKVEAYDIEPLRKQIIESGILAN